MSTKKKIIVGLSGGVDSSVAALLLKQQGFHVEGLFMKNWHEEDQAKVCPYEADLKDVRTVCKLLDIPLHVVSFAEEYWQRVFSQFLDEYRAGRTPNPDILCNREIKFKEFLNYALKLGADFIATGHYAGVKAYIANEKQYFQLKESKDLNKDQTYFLYTLGQHELKNTYFPLQHWTKPEIRQVAKKAGLPTHSKKDSTGICFIGERNFNMFLQEYLIPTPGCIKTPEGKVLGEHPGLLFFTLGQRKGLQIGGRADALQLPWYVVAKDPKTHTLYVTQQPDHPWGISTTLEAKDAFWVQTPSNAEFQAQARVRYRQAKQGCRVFLQNNKISVQFSQPQKAVTPGQAIVFYQDNICLGGATIAATNSAGGILTET